jgi:hypothetical protein
MIRTIAACTSEWEALTIIRISADQGHPYCVGTPSGRAACRGRVVLGLDRAWELGARESGLDRARELGARESGLAVAITIRANGLPRASVVYAGVLAHPVTGEPIVGFVSRGVARKLTDIRERPQVTVDSRSGWERIAVEGNAELAGHLDPRGCSKGHHRPA